MPKIRRTHIVLASAAFAGAIVMGTLALSEVRNLLLYALAPAHARDANLLRLGRGPLDVYLLGTIHGRHLSTPQYGLAHLKSAVNNLRPDVLLVEARPEEIASDHWGDGPIEMPYAALTARAQGIRVAGIDWWRTDRVGRTDEERDDRIYGNLMRYLPTGGTALVMVGYSHVPELRARLERDGFRAKTLASEEKAALFALPKEAFSFPPGMTAAIKQRIADAEGAAVSGAPEFATQMRALAASRREYLGEILRVGER